MSGVYSRPRWADPPPHPPATTASMSAATANNFPSASPEPFEGTKVREETAMLRIADVLRHGEHSGRSVYERGERAPGMSGVVIARSLSGTRRGPPGHTTGARPGDRTRCAATGAPARTDRRSPPPPRRACAGSGTGDTAGAAP